MTRMRGTFQNVVEIAQQAVVLIFLSLWHEKSDFYEQLIPEWQYSDCVLEFPFQYDRM